MPSDDNRDTVEVAEDDFLVALSDYFLQMRGKGLLMSPADLALLVQWETEGVPRGAIARGIDNAFSALEEVRSLRGCRKFIVDEIKQLPRTTVTASIAETVSKQLLDIIEMLRDRADKYPELSIAFERAMSRVDALVVMADDEAATIYDDLQLIETDLAIELLRFMPRKQIRKIETDITKSLEGMKFSTQGDRQETVKETLYVWVLSKYDIEIIL